MEKEVAKGGLRPLFTGGDAFGPYSVIFQVATNDFLKKHPDAVKSYLADYVTGLKWFYDPANRKKAVEITAAFTKSSPKVLDSYFMTKKDYFRDPNACVTAKTIQSPIDAMVAQGLLPKPVKAADYLKLNYLPHPCST
jgi:NitT/TauT family transport system substrate-binding protein